MFKNKREQLEEKYSILFGKSQKTKQMIDFFVKRSLGEISDEELERSVAEIQAEFNYIFETIPPPKLDQPNIGETIYGKIVSKDILDYDTEPKE
jgi:hypothetical protein